MIRTLFTHAALYSAVTHNAHLFEYSYLTLNCSNVPPSARLFKYFYLPLDYSNTLPDTDYLNISSSAQLFDACLGIWLIYSLAHSFIYGWRQRRCNFCRFSGDLNVSKLSASYADRYGKTSKLCPMKPKIIGKHRCTKLAKSKTPDPMPVLLLMVIESNRIQCIGAERFQVTLIPVKSFWILIRYEVWRERKSTTLLPNGRPNVFIFIRYLVHFNW